MLELIKALLVLKFLSMIEYQTARELKKLFLRPSQKKTYNMTGIKSKTISDAPQLPGRLSDHDKLRWQIHIVPVLCRKFSSVESDRNSKISVIGHRKGCVSVSPALPLLPGRFVTNLIIIFGS